jgi:probable HAF family extracellular repeat protein
LAISGDGSVVVGYTPSVPVFRWTLATGMVALPALPNSTYCAVSSVSADGVYSVGMCVVSGSNIPIRWKGTNAPVSLGLPGGFDNGYPTSTNADGSVITGSVNTLAGAQASALWTVGLNPTFIANAPGVESSVGNALSADGSVMVGRARVTSIGVDQGFRWTQATGMQLIPFLPGGTYSGGATDVSADGTKVVGTSAASGGDDRPFLWSSGVLSTVGTSIGNGRAISSDGNTVLSASFQLVATTSGGTTQALATRLTALGVDLGGWVLLDAFDISANGKVIIGNGSHSTTPNSDEGWIAVLP